MTLFFFGFDRIGIVTSDCNRTVPLSFKRREIFFNRVKVQNGSSPACANEK